MESVWFAVAFIGCVRTAPAPHPPPVDDDPLRTIPLTTSSPEARAAFAQAQSLRLALHVDRAEPLFARAVELDPTFAQGWVGMAITRADVRERRADLERAAALAGSLPALERAWIDAQAATFLERPDALDALRALAVAAPDDWFVQFTLGEVARRDDAIDDARTALTRAVRIAPDEPEAYNLLAYVLAEQGAYDEAADTIARYAALSPGEANPLDSEGEILLMAGRLDEAERAFHAAIALDPTFRADGVAAVQLHRGELDAGIATLTETRRTATSEGLRYDLGYELFWAYLTAGRDAAAAEVADALDSEGRSIGIELASVQADLLRARIAIERAQWDAAGATLDAALATAVASADPGAARVARSVRASAVRVALGRGDLAAAERLAAEVTAEAPEDGLSQLTALWLAHHRGDLPAALTALAALADDRFYLPEGRLAAAELLARAGRTADATELRQAVASTYGRDARSVWWRQRARLALGS